MAAGVSFRLLGPVGIVDDAGVPRDVGGPRRRAVLAALLLHRGTSLSVERLVDLLWPYPVPATAATMVHGAVAALRRALERDGEPRVLVTRDGGYALDAPADAVDAARFEQALTDAREERPQQAARRLADALALWRGAALAGVEEPFARSAAAHLEDLRVEARALRADAELRAGHHHALVAELEELTAAHPLREDLGALLVLALYRCGRQADALAACRRLRTALVDELGVEPEQHVRDLELAVLRHDPALAHGPAAASVLPVPLGRLVGRSRELSDLAALLRRHRLVTLTGPGGAGKTRLALEAARREVAVEARMVDLAPLADAALLPESVADAVGVRSEPGQPLERTVGAALAVRPTLLVLDNCEHVVAGCAVLVQGLLAAAPPLRVLATSREPLGVPGERVHPVRPLVVPPPDASEADTAANPAVRLFRDRATAARPDAATAPAALVGELCRRLDGLPLAIELAAARAATLPLRDLVERLDDPVALLESATRSADPRHRSLATTLAWGHALLDAGQQTLFARLAVFPAGFDLPAAAAVRGGSTDVALPLARLVASSLVQLDDQPDGSARYRLLETVRAYAADRLDDAGRVESAERHAAYYLGLSEQVRSTLFGPDSGPGLARLHTERDNLRTALAWFFGHDPGRGVRLVGCLWHYWDMRGARDEGLHWVRAALGAVGPAATDRVPLLAAGALFCLGRADLAETERLATEQLAAAPGTGADAARWEGDALALLATVDWARGRYDRARQRYEDGVDRSLAGGDVWTAALTEAQLARLHRDRREPDAAREVARRGLRHADAVGEGAARGLVRDVLASIEHRWGDPAEAARLAGEALALYRGVGYAEGEASALRLAGRIALHAGRAAEARAALDDALDLGRRIGHRAGTAETLELLVETAAALGDPAAAELGAEAATLRRETGIPRLVGG